MALTGKFIADFSSFYDACQKAEVSVKDIGESANKVGPQLNRMVESFSGKKVIQEATVMARAIEEIGGVSALTEKEMQRVGATMSEALAKMKAAGQPIPKHMQDIADATQNATKAGGGFSSWLSTANGLLTTFGVGLSVGAVVNFGKAVLADADALTKMSDKTGISVEGLQRLRTVADASGNSLDEVTAAVTQMQLRLAGGDQSAVGALNKLGLSLAALKQLQPDQQFTAIASAIGRIEDPMQRARLATDIFGKAGATVLPTMRADIDALAKSTRAMSTETVEALDRAGDAWTKLKRDATAAAGTLIASFQEANEQYRKEAEALTKSGRAADNVIPAMKGLGVVTNALIGPITLTNEQLAYQDGLLRKDTARTNELVSEQKRHAAETATLQKAVHDVNYEIAYSEVHTKALGDQSAYAFEQMNQWRDPSLAAGIGQIGVQLAALDQNFARVAARAKETSAANNVGGALSGLGAQPGLGIPALVMPGITQGFSSMFQTQVPQAILGAIQGGGSPMQAVGTVIGTKLGTNIGNSVAKPLTDGLGKTLGGAIGSLLPGVGALLGPLTSKIGSMIGNMFGGAEKKINPLRDAFIDLHGGLGELNYAAQLAGVTLTQLLDADNPKKYEAAITSLTSALDFQDQSMATLAETAQRYGFTIEELGPAMQRQEMDAQAQQLFKDWEVLNSAGIDTVAITSRMADSINAYVDNAIAMGTEVPEAMRPMLQKMVDMGQLTDASGNRIDDLAESGVTFAMSMSDGFKSLISEVGKLTDAISRGLGLAVDSTTDKINKMPRKVGVEVEYTERNVPTSPARTELEGFQEGTQGFRDFGAGTPVMLHGWEAVVPRERPSIPGSALGTAVTGGEAVTVIINAQGAFFDTPGSLQQLANRVEEALSAKHGLKNKRRAA